MGNYLSSNNFPVEGKTVVITGGSSGMGLAVGQQLAGKGANVAIIARNQGKLLQAIEEIRRAALHPETQRFLELSADLSNPSESTRTLDEIVAWNSGSPPDIVWCCAGSSTPGLFVETPVAQFRAQMDSNYFSSLYMAHAAMTCWVKAAALSAKTGAPGGRSSTTPRHLIFTASFLSFYSFAGYSPYSPAKAALRSLCDTLSQEANLYAASYPNEPAIRLHTIFPGTILTESYQIENTIKPDITKKLEEGDEGQTPETVAAESIKGLEGGLQLISTNLLTALVQRSMLGGSLRGGFLRMLADWFLAWLMGLVMVVVRSDMDSKVRSWGQKHGASGKVLENKQA
ncbi:putative 3-ketodihydrosphingosine reductase tsc10 [Rosellinia necatrix]|uniref:3-dehydrosphinganine reductase n=1 Tax=Rosellinia necatrix TaxID=77044 RepID=A0A1W2TSM3_ROSNE|nr:putative 3-ketodihydrosphingosine reductase tsc10 [Rosellinia necatrix]